MKYFTVVVVLVLAGCGIGPKPISVLTKNGISYQSRDSHIDLAGSRKKLMVQYIGCGGLYLQMDSGAILIDPFFSNQKVMRIGSSMFGKRKISSDPHMVDTGIRTLTARYGDLRRVKTILSAHSHYDHLMDVPAVFKKLDETPTVYLNRSGYNTCYNVIDTNQMKILERYMTTRELSRAPIELKNGNRWIHIYPILSEHNPHVKNIKFFSGSKTQPVAGFTDEWSKTSVNDWLEGNVFSFLIDYLDDERQIEFRVFVQSSTCNAPAGIPPVELLKKRPVDVAFLGVASYRFSPGYPCDLMDAINAREIVWIHWEDFFRKYTKKPKIARGTDVPKFFEIPCVSSYKSRAFLPWPGVAYEFE